MYRNRYEHIIQPAIDGLLVNNQQAFRCIRADFVTKTGSITRDLLGRLYRSDAVLADLTDLNPNVFYELGVRHALRAGTILIALKGTRPPFDVGDLRVIPYEDRVGGEKEAIPQIQEMSRSVLADDRPQDSPVLHAIPELAELGAVKDDPQTVFVLMPLNADQQPVFEVIREAADRSGLRSFRADAISAAGSIIDQIYESIATSGLIVADLTGRNQNVMYELGIANAMGKVTVLLSQGIDEVPFDLRSQRVLTYNLSLNGMRELRDRLMQAFEHYRHETAA